MNSWYVVHTQPRSEGKAAFHLHRQRFRVYLPRYRRTVRHARREEVVAAPLFPRYLFIAFDASSCAWRAVLSTVGVSHLIVNADGPMPVPEGVVEAIQARQQDDGLITLAEARPLHSGDLIIIGEGPFADCMALFESRDPNHRVTLLMTIMGRETRIQMPARNIFAA